MALGSLSDARRLERIPTNLEMVLLLGLPGSETASFPDEVVLRELGVLRRVIRLKVSTVDMSLLGVRIRSVGALLPGQTVTLIPSQASFHAYPCRVVWVGPSGLELQSEAGLEFVAVAKLIQRS